jgi:hypothetical protein
MSVISGPLTALKPCFVWDGTNPKCWNGSSSSHYDLVSGSTGTFSGAGSVTRSGGHVVFAPNPIASTQTAIISFPSSGITVPTGSSGTWSYWYYYTSSQTIDAPNFGKETGSNWDGINGFVMGTGWGTDGLRMGVGGTAVYVPGSGGPYYVYNTWQQITVTYVQNGSWIEYVNGTPAFTTTAPNVPIGSNSNALIIGSTNSRGGNWRGSMDIIQMWPRDLSAQEVLENFNALRGRYGI